MVKCTNGNGLRERILKPCRKAGFTLAEVLITLGIIGVVAAMTIPVLMSNIHVTRFKSQSRKTLATLNQAVKMSVAQYGFDFAGASEESDLTKLDPTVNASIASMLAGTLSGATLTNNIKMPDGTLYYRDNYQIVGIVANQTDCITAMLPDGSFFTFDKKSKNCTVSRKCLGIIDFNGVSKPNIDLPCDYHAARSYNSKDRIGPYGDICELKKAPAQSDMIQVYFYDGVVEPVMNSGYLFLFE